MKTEFMKWGNSLAVRVPKAFAQEIGASEGKRAEMTVENGALVIKPAEPTARRRYSLQRLTDAITAENLHGETGWGAPRGHEVW